MSERADQSEGGGRGGEGGRADGGARGGLGGGGAESGAAAGSDMRGGDARTAALAILGPVLLTTAYFTVPFDVLGPGHPVLAPVIVGGLLALLAAGMVVTTNRALTDQTGRYRHPGLSVLLLSWAAILVFAAGYWALATRRGQFVGLETRLDALYFTGVTMATVGYGDVHPSGQEARAVVLVQLVYTFAFLVGGVTAVRTRARDRLARRRGGGG